MYNMSIYVWEHWFRRGGGGIHPPLGQKSSFNIPVQWGLRKEEKEWNGCWGKNKKVTTSLVDFGDKFYLQNPLNFELWKRINSSIFQTFSTVQAIGGGGSLFKKILQPNGSKIIGENKWYLLMGQGVGEWFWWNIYMYVYVNPNWARCGRICAPSRIFPILTHL